jgi:hypothetical protein
MCWCNVVRRCLPSVSQIQINFGLFDMYIVLHVRFKTTCISALYSCMNGLQTSWSLIQIFESTFILIIIYMSLLHPLTHSSSLCGYIPLTFLLCMHIYMHTHSPLGILYIAHTCSRSLGRFPTISLGLSICLFPTHTDRYTPLATSAYHTQTCTHIVLPSSHYPCLPP